MAASRRGARSVLFVCPTSGGKTHVFAELARLAHERGARTLVLTDRLELVEQAAAQIERLAGLRAAFEQGPRRAAKGAPVVCATIQSIRQAQRLRRFAPDAFGLIVVDEADLGVAPSYKTVLERFPGAFVFGCTATPDRHDGQNLGAIFEEVVARVEMGDLIRAGYLSPLRRHLVRIESVSLEKVPARDGDFSDAALTRILTQERPLHEVVRPALDLAGERPALVFAATVAHAQALADVFNRYRPGAARMMHGGMGDAERAEVLGAYRRREFQFLVNCALLLRGVDLPFVSCIVGARPTLSRSLYAQSIGRGTRVCEGKTDLLVLDFTDNSATHDLVSPIDVLAPSAPEETKERAREIMDEEQGADPLEALDRSEVEIAADPALRERVRAKVAFRLRESPSLNKGIDWDAQPLGKVPDEELARRLGVDPSTVTDARQRRDIARFPDPRRIDWDAQAQHLGRVPDAELAQRLGVSSTTVNQERRRRGIPAAPNPRHNGIDWASQPLGRLSDEELAQQLGVHRATVGKARRRRGIANVNPRAGSKGIDWSKQPLGKLPDSELARRLGIDQSSVTLARQRRDIKSCLSGSANKGIPWNDLPLGKVPDAELARQLGVNSSVVQYARQRRDIPPCPDPNPRHKGINYAELPLGKVPDAEIARRIGIRAGTVGWARKRRGIPPFRPGGGDGGTPPAGAAP